MCYDTFIITIITPKHIYLLFCYKPDVAFHSKSMHIIQLSECKKKGTSETYLLCMYLSSQKIFDFFDTKTHLFSHFGCSRREQFRGKYVVGCGNSIRYEVTNTSLTAAVVAVSFVI